jgi:transcriptional regulator with XRE-family HTH domain
VEHKPNEEEDALTPEGLAGEQLRRLRLARGWSQEEVARRMAAFDVDWHQTTVGRTETAQRPLRLNEAFALAALFRVGLSTLIGPPRVDPATLGDDELKLKYGEAAGQMEALGEARAEAEKKLEQAAADHAFWGQQLSQVRMNFEIQSSAVSELAKERDRREGPGWGWRDVKPGQGTPE